MFDKIEGEVAKKLIGKRIKDLSFESGAKGCLSILEITFDDSSVLEIKERLTRGADDGLYHSVQFILIENGERKMLLIT